MGAKYLACRATAGAFAPTSRFTAGLSATRKADLSNGVKYTALVLLSITARGVFASNFLKDVNWLQSWIRPRRSTPNWWAKAHPTENSILDEHRESRNEYRKG